tara:strand:+ start:89 stop:1063 length:975 start_codon:yes stop_codon:yes gene_type:complete
MNRKAVIDCGTNTFNLRIVDFNQSLGPGRWMNVFSLRLPVKLGKGGVGRGIILQKRIKRGIDAIDEMREAILNYRATEVQIFATSALRDASNRLDFVNTVYEKFGYKVNIISGSTEALLIQSGIELTYQAPENTSVLTMDIGGGSTECILWNNSEIFWSRSFDVGVARMASFFKKTDVFGSDANEAYDDMKPYLENILHPLKVALENVKPSVLVGSSGSFDTFSSVINPAADYIKSDEHPPASEIDLASLMKLCGEMMHNSLKDRLVMKGMPPDRADNIPYAAAIVRWAIENSDVQKMYRSEYALREGVLNRLSKGQTILPGLE